MLNKEKQLNKIREVHRVGRSIKFNNKAEREMFRLLCDDKLHNVGESDRDGYWLGFTIEKSVFDELVNKLGLINIHTERYKTKYWSTRAAQA